MKTQSLVLVAVLVVAVIASGAYLSGAFSSGSSAKTQTVDMQIVGGVGVGTVDEYVPANFTVKQGNDVTLVILNTDDNQHGIALPSFGVNNTLISPGDTVRISFVANQTGTFYYNEPPGDCKGGYGGVCNSVQHMWGWITVAPP